MHFDIAKGKVNILALTSSSFSCLTLGNTSDENSSCFSSKGPEDAVTNSSPKGRMAGNGDGLSNAKGGTSSGTECPAYVGSTEDNPCLDVSNKASDGDSAIVKFFLSVIFKTADSENEISGKFILHGNFSFIFSSLFFANIFLEKFDINVLSLLSFDVVIKDA